MSSGRDNLRLLSILKKIPIDFGQESVAETTMGKKIAQRLVPVVDDGLLKRALDVGCRKGIQSIWLQDRGYEVVSIDIENVGYKDCILTDVNEGLPFPDSLFDLVWCSEVLEHLINPNEAVNEFLRVTRPGGRILLTTPNSHFWFFLIMKFFGFDQKRLQRDDHLHFFKISDIKMIARNGRIYGYFPYFLFKFVIKDEFLINFLSPTFVIMIKKSVNRVL